MSSNYPAGVSDSHPYFNPPAISASAVECGADEALVVPFHAVRAELDELQEFIALKLRGAGDMPYFKSTMEMLAARISSAQDGLTLLKQEREYECPFNDDVDLEESECARWDCPVCGNERETDTMPEERDPDYEHDHMGEGR